MLDDGTLRRVCNQMRCGFADLLLGSPSFLGSLFLLLAAGLLDCLMRAACCSLFLPLLLSGPSFRLIRLGGTQPLSHKRMKDKKPAGLRLRHPRRSEC